MLHPTDTLLDMAHIDQPCSVGSREVEVAKAVIATQVCEAKSLEAPNDISRTPRSRSERASFYARADFLQHMLTSSSMPLQCAS